MFGNLASHRATEDLQMTMEAKHDEARAKGPRPNLTVFGTCLYTLMLSRGIVTATKLSEILEEAGHPTSHQKITNYWRGDAQPTKKFFQDVAEVLQLSREEKLRLSGAHCYEEDLG
jgi:hypothetical protein